MRHAPFFIADAVVCSEMAGVFRGKGRGWLGKTGGHLYMIAISRLYLGYLWIGEI